MPVYPLNDPSTGTGMGGSGSGISGDVNVQSDWEQTNKTKDSYISNVPSALREGAPFTRLLHFDFTKDQSSMDIDWSELDLTNFQSLQVSIDYIFEGTNSQNLYLRGIIDGELNTTGIYNYHSRNYRSSSFNYVTSTTGTRAIIIPASGGLYSSSTYKNTLSLNIVGFKKSEVAKIEIKGDYYYNGSWRSAESHITIDNTDALDGVSIYHASGTLRGECSLYGTQKPTQETIVYSMKDISDMLSMTDMPAMIDVVNR